MFYILFKGISPNTASGNRFLSFLRGFDELCIDGTAVLLMPSEGHYRIQEKYHHLRVKYLWRDWPFCRKVLDWIYRQSVFGRFKSLLKEGDIVFCYGSPEYLADLMAVKGIRVFHERTESPEVLPLSSSNAQHRYLDACKQLDGLFVITTALKSYFESKGIPPERISIINITVDNKRFDCLTKTPGAENYIAYCGNASNNKDGVDELIKAFFLVRKKHGDIKLYIIGKAPSKVDESGNIKLIQSLGLKENVVFTGMVKADKMPQLLKDAMILALDRPDSLQAQNGFPTKLGEYLMTENPVVATKVGDIPNFLKDGESALLAEQRNPEDFASKLCWALEHPVESSIIGKKGKEVAMKEFNYLIESKKIVDAIGIMRNQTGFKC